MEIRLQHCSAEQSREQCRAEQGDKSRRTSHQSGACLAPLFTDERPPRLAFSNGPQSPGVAGASITKSTFLHPRGRTTGLEKSLAGLKHCLGTRCEPGRGAQ